MKTATAKTANDIWADRTCLTPHDTISLAELSLRGAGCPPALEELAPSGIKLERPNGLAGPVVRLSDLDTLLGPEKAQAVRAYSPDMVPVVVVDLGGILGMPSDDEALSVAARRGVRVDGDQVDKTALEALGRILTAERAFPWNDSDTVVGNTPLQDMQRLMVTKDGFPDGIPPLPPPPPPPGIWGPVRRAILGPAELPRRIYDADAETRERCRIMGVRTEKGTLDGGYRLRICGWDLVRLLGLTFTGTSRRQLRAYSDMQRAAYESVFPQTGKDT